MNTKNQKMWLIFKKSLTLRKIWARQDMPALLLLPTLITPIVILVAIIDNLNPIYRAWIEIGVDPARAISNIATRLPDWATGIIATIPYWMVAVLAISILSIALILTRNWFSLLKIRESLNGGNGKLFQSKQGYWIIDNAMKGPIRVSDETIHILEESGVTIKPICMFTNDQEKHQPTFQT